MLIECRVRQPAELIIVEGKHAANAVDHARNKDTQAILAMQGKVPNITKSSLQSQIDNNDRVRLLADTLSSTSTSTESAQRKFNRVMILSDPDLDGVHAALLLICLVAEVWPQLVRDECLHWCRSPQYKINSTGSGPARFAYSKTELQRYRAECDGPLQVQRFKGVASIPTELLRQACIDPVSRTPRVVSQADCAELKKQLAQPLKPG